MMKKVTVTIEFENGESEVKEYTKFGFWKIKHFNKFGKLAKYEDWEGNREDYIYDEYGNLMSSKDSYSLV